jgi:hypothetical protein
VVAPVACACHCFPFSLLHGVGTGKHHCHGHAKQVVALLAGLVMWMQDVLWCWRQQMMSGQRLWGSRIGSQP